jgi:hypothetical protein
MSLRERKKVKYTFDSDEDIESDGEDSKPAQPIKKKARAEPALPAPLSTSHMRIEKILSHQISPLDRWQQILSEMNTREVVRGSVFENMEESTERFLCKWVGLSYVHCSWETKAALQKMTVNGSRMVNKLLTRTEEEPDVDVAAYTVIERILGYMLVPGEEGGDFAMSPRGRSNSSGSMDGWGDGTGDQDTSMSPAGTVASPAGKKRRSKQKQDDRCATAPPPLHLPPHFLHPNQPSFYASATANPKLTNSNM